MDTFFKKLIPNNIAAIIGVAQVLVPLVRELAVVVIRIVDIFTPGAGLEALIVTVVSVFTKIETGVDKLKNMFLGA